MTTKTRLILLLVLVALFLVVAPSLALYSLGYRINFEDGRITTTGGIYIRVQPVPVNITVDENIHETTGVFSNSVFVQNLLSGEHNIIIKKEGYYDYQKNLLVKEKEVTKLENVILFNKNIPFETLSDITQFSLFKKKPPERFIINKNNLYYSDSEENSQLTALQKNTPILKNIVAFKVSGNSILWLGLDGFLKNSDLTGQNTETISQAVLKVDAKKSYLLEEFSQHIFLKEGNAVLLFDQGKKLFQNFYSPVKEIKISPDGQKILYFNDNEIFIYYFSNLPTGLQNNALLQKASEKIGDVYWLNNDYIIFNRGSQISIFEIDYRGNINTISLSPNLLLTNGENIEVVKPEIFFDQPTKKLYILTQNNLLVSDRLIP